MEGIEVYNDLLVKGQEEHSKMFRKGPVWAGIEEWNAGIAKSVKNQNFNTVDHFS